MKKRIRKAVKTVSIDIDLLDRMEDYTDETGMSISELIRRSAAFYLDIEEKAKKENKHIHKYIMYVCTKSTYINTLCMYALKAHT